MSKRPNPELIDDESPELTEEWFRRAVPFSALPESLQAKLRQIRGAEIRLVRDPPVKERVSLSLSSRTLDYFRATGAGWRARMDDALKDWVAQHA